METEEFLRANLKAIKAEFRAFLSEFNKMREAQRKEEKSRIDPQIKTEVYNSLYYQKYLCEKYTDEQFDGLTKKYLI